MRQTCDLLSTAAKSPLRSTPASAPSAPPNPLLKSITASRPRKAARRRSSLRCRSVIPERMGEPQAPVP